MKSSSTNSKTNNSNDHDDSNDMIMENNGNIFLSNFLKCQSMIIVIVVADNLRIIHQCQIHYCIIQENTQSERTNNNNNSNQNNRDNHNILDLPTEYLISKPLPKLPIPEKGKI